MCPIPAVTHSNDRSVVVRPSWSGCVGEDADGSVVRQPTCIWHAAVAFTYVCPLLWCSRDIGDICRKSWLSVKLARRAAPPVAPPGRRPATFWYCTVYVVKPPVIRLRTPARLPLIHAPRAVRASSESIPAVACARTLTNFDIYYVS